MSVAEQIVDVLLESDEVDPKAFTARHSDAIYNTWEQVDGDVDWWEFGGTFHNPGLGQLVHIPGLEGAELKDWAGWDIELTPEQLAPIQAQFPVDIDPEWPEGGDQNEHDRERAIDALKDKLAEQKNVERKMPVYRWLDDSITDYSDHFPAIEEQTQMSMDDLSLGAQWAALGQMIGWHEFDDAPDYYTWDELDKYLQPREDFRGRSRQQHHLPEAP